jgi:RHS repeat-associated protein
MVPSTGTVTFKYDPFGRRAQKSGPLGTTNYLYDGANAIVEVGANGAVLARYSQGLDIDEPLAELRGSTTSYYEADGLGSIASLSNVAGALANTYTYDSFGQLTASTGTLVNPFQHTGREFDGETGLYYNRARYYDQNIGRFVSEDPIRWTAGVNFVAFVTNNPQTWRDPTGLQAGLPPSVQMTISQFVGGAWSMWHNYRSLRDANFIGIDKYFHCMGNCEAAAQGPGGRLAATIISEAREDSDFWRGRPLWDSVEDMRANEVGRCGASDCRKACSRYLMPGFTPK